MLRFCAVFVLLLVALSFGGYSQDVTEMSEADLLTELAVILEQQEKLLEVQSMQIANLKAQLQTAKNSLTEASIWQQALTQQISRLQTLHQEQEQLLRNYKDEKEREIRRLKFALVGVSIGAAGLGGLNIYQAVK